MLLERPGVHVVPRVRDFVAGTRPMLIGEEWTEASDGRTFPTIDPATGEEICRVAEAGEHDVERAVAVARWALGGPWGRISARDRGLLLFRLADLIADRAEEFAQLDSLDNGKPLAYARAVDLPLAIEHFRYFAGWTDKVEGATVPVSNPDMHVYTRREPVGVVGAIIPWNFPLVNAAFKLAPALAAGCTVVLKPAEQTPLSSLLLGELILEAGIPPGVVNICPGYGERAGAALVRHPDVDKIAFTGSTSVGREVARAAAESVKQVSLELGGKNPNIVFADADIEAAAAGAAQAIFFNSGQVCTAGSRLMVERSVYDDLLNAVVEHARGLRLGPGLLAETTLGPVVSEELFERVSGYIESGRREGGEILLGGDPPEGDLADGYFVEPTIIANVPDRLTVCREEIFGPVLVAQPFDALDEVAARANDTPYGLAAAVWTKDHAKAHRLAAKLRVGTVWINSYHGYDAAASFGGYKQSGYGHECGRAALEKFLQLKTVWTSLA